MSNRVNIGSIMTRWDPVLENSLKGSFMHSFWIKYREIVSEFAFLVPVRVPKSQTKYRK